MKIGVALSGGGIKGIAHAGALKAIEDIGIKVDIIGGTSSGSLVAALYAMGFKPKDILKLFNENADKIVKIGKNPIISSIGSYIRKKQIKIKGLKTGNTLETLYDQIAKEKGIFNINQIKMPLVIPSVDILNSKEYIFTNKLPTGNKNIDQYITDINIGKAVRASSSFSAVFSPCEYKNHAFIDGGALNNIPVNEVKKQGADKVIAIKFDSDLITNKSNIMDIAFKTIDIMGNKICEKNLQMSDYIVNVSAENIGFLDTKQMNKCFDAGYDAVINNANDIKNILYKNL